MFIKIKKTLRDITRIKNHLQLVYIYAAENLNEKEMRHA